MEIPNFSSQEGWDDYVSKRSSNDSDDEFISDGEWPALQEKLISKKWLVLKEVWRLFITSMSHFS